MKRKSLLVVVVSVVVVLVGVLVAAAQAPRSAETLSAASPLPLGTGFTYQGQLKSSGAPVHATCAFIFKLFDNPSGGAQIGSNVAATIPITNGLFTTVLDFGTGAFTGDARWLDMQVKCPPAAVYTPLAPRQALTPAPMALALPGLWTEQNATSPNLIGGYSGNVISPSVVGATIGGGGQNGSINRITTGSDFATIGGGLAITASGLGATVGGGQYNTASDIGATVGGGYGNTAITGTATVGGGSHNMASGPQATVGGGYLNTASGDSATLSGGFNNTASGVGATVPGGKYNTASGDYSFAAGNYADTNNKTGAFVWGDKSVNTEIFATAPNQFLIRAAGGVGIGTNAPIANSLTVNGQIIAGDAVPPTGGEPFLAEGSLSGYAMLDRLGGTYKRWVVYPNGGELRFYNDGFGDAVKISAGGILTAAGGFKGQCLSSGQFNTSAANACNMDVAEAFASLDRTEPGDVVALVTQPAGGRLPAAGPAVRKAGRTDGALVVGVVSSNPGLVFDNGQTHLAGDNSQLITADRTVVALIGRVPVKVSLENGPIAVGDPLTGASAAGLAMRATQAGQIIGYALQSSDELSEGKLLAWLQPGLYMPPAQVARLNASPAAPDSAALAAQVAQLQARNAILEQQNATIEAHVTSVETKNAALAQQNTSQAARITALDARVTALAQSIQSSAPGRAADNSIPPAWLLFGGLIVVGVVALRTRA